MVSIKTLRRKQREREEGKISGVRKIPDSETFNEPTFGQLTGRDSQEQKDDRPLGRKFTDIATGLPFGIGTTIKTLATGFSTLLGEREAAEEQLGRITGRDIATTAATVGTLAIGAAGVGTALAKRATTSVGSISPEILAKLQIGSKTAGTLKAGRIMSLIPKLTLKNTGFLVGGGVIANWFAADNIGTGSQIAMTELRKQVQFGARDPFEAIAIADNLQESFDTAASFINFSTMLNPALWAFRNFYQSGLETQRMIMTADKQLIENAAGGAFAQLQISKTQNQTKLKGGA